MSHWLFKTEPSEYSFADLARDKRVVWEGVSSNAALLHLRAVKKGDTVVVYHSGKDKGAVGLAEVSHVAYPNPKLGQPKRVVVDWKARHAFTTPVPLADFRVDPVLK